jgi:hypothetical protein
MPEDAAHISEDLEKLVKRDLCPFGSMRLDARAELLDELNELNQDPKRLNQALDHLHKAKDLDVKEVRDQAGNVVSIDFSDPYGATMADCRKRIHPRDRTFQRAVELVDGPLALHDRIDVLSPKERQTMNNIVEAIEKGNKPELEKLIKGFTGNNDGISRLLPHINSTLLRHNAWLSVAAGLGEHSVFSVYSSRSKQSYYVNF